jgi:5-hydroxyisourate hydrolase
MASLSTHVLDTVHGTPAQGVVIDLYALQDGGRQHLKTTVTNANGRTAEPLGGDELRSGTYELVFHAGAYLRSAGIKLTEPPFLDQIVIRFGIGDLARHYHVPLLLSTYGYSTYLGS